MTPMYPSIELTHANSKVPTRFVVGVGFTYNYYAPAKAVCIYTAGGIFPVSESLDEITSKINSINSPAGQGEISERTEQTV